MDFQDPPKSEKVARNPNNANILKGGKVDPRSQLYQRSVAGREQLKDYLSRLSSSGKDEADVFMAGVKSLMNRGHGYVGAYLDSKNPGRRYEKNQAMAITDKVMTDEGIGEHPGARLTRPKVEDEEGNIDKEATKEARDKRKEDNEGRGSGPQQAPGPSAKPVGQQRKEGKRESTGQPLEDSRRDKKIGDSKGGPFYQPVSKDDGSGSVDVKREWQQEMASGFEKIKTDLKTGEITPEEAKSQISELNSRSKEFVKGGKQEREQGLKDDAAVYKRREDRKKQRDGGQPPADGAQPPAQPPSGEAQPPADGASVDEETANAPEGKSAKQVEVDDFTKNSVIKKNVIDFLNGRSNLANGKKLSRYMLAVSKGQEDPEYLSELFDGISKEISDSYREETDINLDPNSIKDSILETIRSSKDVAKKFGSGLESIQSTPRSSPGQQGAAGPEPTAAPEAKPPQPGQQEAAAPQGGGQEAQAPATREPLPEERLGRGRKRSGGKAAPGFTTEIGKEATDTIRQAVSQGKSVEEVVEQFINGNLFGGTGVETGSAATNPLEDSPPDQYERFRGDPAEKFKGAQAGSREQGSGSLFVSPETAKKRGVKSTIDTESGPAENPELYTSPRTGAGYGPAGKEQKGRIESKNAIQRVATENMTKEEKDKISSDILGGGGTLREARQATGTKPRKAKKARKPKTINSSEYQEFAQSVRSMMR